MSREPYRRRVSRAVRHQVATELDRLEGWTQGGADRDTLERACMYVLRHGMEPVEAARAAHAWDKNLREQAQRRLSHGTGCV